MLQPDLRACKLSTLIRFFTSRPGMHAACTQRQSSLDSKHPIMSDKTRSSRRRLRKVRLRVATPPFRKASRRPSVGWAVRESAHEHWIFSTARLGSQLIIVPSFLLVGEALELASAHVAALTAPPFLDCIRPSVLIILDLTCKT